MIQCVAMSEEFAAVNSPCNLMLQEHNVWVSIIAFCNLSFFFFLITGLDQLSSAGLPLTSCWTMKATCVQCDLNIRTTVVFSAAIGASNII